MKKFGAMLLIIIILTTIITSCFAEVLMPQQGKKTKKNGSLIVDYSNCSEGYVMIKAKPNKKHLKVRFTCGKENIHYDLNQDGEYEVFPLSFGNGKYTIELFKQKAGTSYEKIGSVTLNIKMPDPNRAFLYPNQWINYTPETPAVIHAQKLCEGITDPEEKVLKIYCDLVFDMTESTIVLASDNTINEYKSDVYFKLESQNITGSKLPEIDKTFETGKGVCKDHAAVLTAMLRSVGIPTKFAVMDQGPPPSHAYVIAIVNDEEIIIDPSAPYYTKMNEGQPKDRIY